MPRWVVKQNREHIWLYYLTDRLAQCATHRSIVWTIGELTYNQATDLLEHATHTQIMQHAINMIVVLANIFDKQNRRLCTLLNHTVQTIWSTLQAIQYTKVTTYQFALDFTLTVEGRRWCMVYSVWYIGMVRRWMICQW